VWAALVRQRALVEKANKRLSQQSTETAELRVAYAMVKEEAVQAREAEATTREDTARAWEEAAKAREDLAPLLARVKELEEDITLVGGQRDALNIQVGTVSARVRTLEDEVVTLRDTVHDRYKALRASEKTCGELRDEVMGWQTHFEGKASCCVVALASRS
jgi:chromosome segregation ATPase